MFHPFPLHCGWDQLGGSGECLGAGEPIVGSHPVRQLNSKTPGFWGCEFWLLEHWNSNTIVTIVVIIVIQYIYIYQDCIDFMKWDPEVLYGLMFRGVLMAILKIG